MLMHQAELGEDDKNELLGLDGWGSNMYEENV